jgi:hypothetical protein
MFGICRYTPGAVLGDVSFFSGIVMPWALRIVGVVRALKLTETDRNALFEAFPEVSDRISRSLAIQTRELGVLARSQTALANANIGDRGVVKRGSTTGHGGLGISMASRITTRRSSTSSALQTSEDASEDSKDELNDEKVDVKSRSSILFQAAGNAMVAVSPSSFPASTSPSPTGTPDASPTTKRLGSSAGTPQKTAQRGGVSGAGASPVTKRNSISPAGKVGKRDRDDRRPSLSPMTRRPSVQFNSFFSEATDFQASWRTKQKIEPEKPKLREALTRWAILCDAAGEALAAQRARHSQKLAGTLCDLAAKNHTIEMARILSTSGSLADIPSDYDGRTPAHLAAACGHFEMLTLIIDKGANVSVSDNFGRTPLYEVNLIFDPYFSQLTQSGNRHD